MAKVAKTRFERMVPPGKAPAKPKKSRSRPKDWEEQARFRGAFPFEHEEKVWDKPSKHRPLETILQDSEDKEPEPQFRMESRINRFAVHQTALVAFENSLHQAYVTGYADAVRQLEVLDAILRRHSRSEALRSDVATLIRKIKDDLASGYKCLPG